MNINQILKEELQKIVISDDDLLKLRKRADEIISKINCRFCEAFVGGSLAKGTLMKKNVQDIDIFVVFKNENDIQKLEEILTKAKFDFKIIHGSRDYFQIKEEDVVFEIIPVTKTGNNNITDFSLSHVKYVLKKIKKNPKIVNEIKLAKAFCYSQNVYGAESYIKGFSGYALELLVIYFKSFVNFLKKIDKERVIDSEKQFKNKKQIMEELNESKIKSPLILIDPTYKFRNVAAGLSKESFSLFLDSAKKFLKSPSMKFFEKKEISEDNIKKFAKKKNAKFIELLLRTQKQEGDIAGTKMKKFFEFIVRELERKQQRVLMKEFSYDNGNEAKVYLVVRESKEIEIKGPPMSNKYAVKNFKRVRKKITIKKGFAYACEKVSLDDVFDYLKRFEDEMSVEFEIL